MVEGIPTRPISDGEIVEYLRKLSTVIGMVTIAEPVTHKSEQYGWAGWIHWETSGAHFYAWDRLESGEEFLFFSVDVYACKPFEAAKAVEFTREFFSANEVVHRGF